MQIQFRSEPTPVPRWPSSPASGEGKGSTLPGQSPPMSLNLAASFLTSRSWVFMINIREHWTKRSRMEDATSPDVINLRMIGSGVRGGSKADYLAMIDSMEKLCAARVRSISISFHSSAGSSTVQKNEAMTGKTCQCPSGLNSEWMQVCSGLALRSVSDSKTMAIWLADGMPLAS